MTKIRSIFIRGLVTVLPIALTIYILYTGILIFENLLGNFIKFFIPQSDYVPGIGFGLTIILIFLIGLILNNLVTASFWAAVEKKLFDVPLIKVVYGPLRDLMNLFSKSGQKDLKSVVLVQVSSNVQLLGLVTRETFQDLGISLSAELQNKVSVYVPMSYGLGGFTLLVSKDQIQRIDIPVEKALQLSITGWVATHKEDSRHG